ncbi:MAG TPA: acyloxyacyl hydrolase [Gammaproteobacteria bacterium]|nr:acyloxyacyl hydrolase [Gammaproteobacteria bacterium]
MRRPVPSRAWLRPLAAGLLLAASGTAPAAVSLEAGRNPAGDVGVWRLSLDRPLAAPWGLDGGRSLGPLWEASLGRLRARPGSPGDRPAVYEMGLRLVLRLGWGDAAGPFLEAGSGPEYLTRSHLDGHDLGIHWQFRSHAGVGMRFGAGGRWRLTYRYSHTSNANLGKPNDGINFHVLRLGAAF